MTQVRHRRPDEDEHDEQTQPEQKEPLTLDQIKQMTPAEINADWDRVSEALEGGSR